MDGWQLVSRGGNQDSPWEVDAGGRGKAVVGGKVSPDSAVAELGIRRHAQPRCRRRVPGPALARSLDWFPAGLGHGRSPDRILAEPPASESLHRGSTFSSMRSDYDSEREAEDAMKQAVATEGMERQSWLRLAQAWSELARGRPSVEDNENVA